ncbi:MAG: hypothetical protein NHB15_16160 [Methanosarcina barkeri]|nr:hypothetical protein [Methanosarcina sp. ERenArc_MAG2]
MIFGRIYKDGLPSYFAPLVKKELQCLKEAWQDWLSCDNDFACRNIEMRKAEDRNYFNLVSIIATKV